MDPYSHEHIQYFIFKNPYNVSLGYDLYIVGKRGRSIEAHALYFPLYYNVAKTASFMQRHFFRDHANLYHVLYLSQG